MSDKDFGSDEDFKEVFQDVIRLTEQGECVVLRMDLQSALNIYAGLITALRSPEMEDDTLYDECEKAMLYLQGQLSKTPALKKMCDGMMESVPQRKTEFQSGGFIGDNPISDLF
jgi:hypothetical protein